MTLFNIFSTPSGLRANSTIKRKGHSHWLRDELNYLRENYHKKSVEELVEHLGRTAPAIRAKAGHLGLGRKQPKNAWLPREDKFLQENYHKLTGEEIAKKLGRTYYAVRNRARILGVASKR